jgi:hypothetical protein
VAEKYFSLHISQNDVFPTRSIEKGEIMVCLALLYVPEDGKPFRIANIADKNLLVQAAHAAIHEQDCKAACMDEVDGVLGAVEREESRKLRAVMNLLMPELETAGVPTVM